MATFAYLTAKARHFNAESQRRQHDAATLKAKCFLTPNGSSQEGLAHSGSSWQEQSHEPCGRKYCHACSQRAAAPQRSRSTALCITLRLRFVNMIQRRLSPVGHRCRAAHCSTSPLSASPDCSLTGGMLPRLRIVTWWPSISAFNTNIARAWHWPDTQMTGFKQFLPTRESDNIRLPATRGTSHSVYAVVAGLPKCASLSVSVPT